MDKTTSTSSSSAAAVADSASAAANTKIIKNNMDSSSSSKTSIELVIKASNQQCDDQIIESDLLFTVKQLKTQLSLIYPGRPAIADQKLIYSGHLLGDTMLLKDVIRSYKDVYTQNHILHLVYTPKNVPPSKVSQNVAQPNKSMATPLTAEGLRQRHVTANTSQQQAPTIQQQLPQSPNFANANPQLMSQWLAAAQAQANAAAMATPATTAAQFPPVDAAAMSITMGQYNMQQAMAMQQAAYMAWMQQAYTQYIDQCLRLSNGNTAQSMTPNAASGSSTDTSAASGNMNAMRSPVMHPFLQQMPFLAPPNAAGGLGTAGAAATPVIPPTSAAVAAPAPAPAGNEQQPMELPQQDQQVAPPRFPHIVQDDQDNRDWLDRFIAITRLAIFLTILYFNSSPLRCIIVGLFAGGIYLYHIGVLRLRHERNNNNINRNNNAAAVADQIRQGVQQVQQAQAAQEQQQPGGDGDNPANVAAGAGPTNNDADVPPPAAETAEDGASNVTATHATDAEDDSSNSVISFVRTFVVTFFTSLLPETPAL